jgi:DNA-binding NarL/FixJ family response regulator
MLTLNENIITIAIADDNKVLRQSLRIALDNYPNLSVQLDTSNGTKLLEKLKTNPVDIILLDLEIAVMNGFELLRKLSDNYPKIKCLILSYFNDPDFVMNALDRGAKGFIAKNDSLEMLQRAIVTVHEGMLFLDSDHIHLLKNGDPEDLNSRKTTHPFTPKELTIIRLACNGKTNKEIAEEIEISIKTVENHRSNIFIKAGVKNVAQLVLYAIQEGIIVAT